MDYLSTIMLIVIILACLGCLFFIHFDWKRYGVLFILSLISANVLCYLFTFFGFYSFPYNVLNDGLIMPFALVSTVFPVIVMFGVRYSPEKWAYKIPFYWGIVHVGVFLEVVLKSTPVFKFEPEWDLWDSYTLWWLYYLIFEFSGEKLIPASKRNPILGESFRYGRWAWIVFHVIVIITIFLAGVYVGVTVIK